MRLLLRPWPLALLLVLVCGGLLFFLHWTRQRADSSNAALVARLPTEDSVQVFIDVQALRQAGLLELLAGSRAVEETDYRRFVNSTGFDYREDLDALLVSKRPGDLYCLLRGRFNWDQLKDYTTSVGGTCRNAFCFVQSDRPGHFVSFYALLPNVLALAIAPSPQAAYALADRYGPEPAAEEIRYPVWVKVATSFFKAEQELPAGTRVLANAVKKAERVTLALDASGNAYEATLRAQCKTVEEAEEITKHLQEMTGMLRKFFARDKQTPNPRDLSGVLTAGDFRRENTTVLGRWPIQRVFLESLAQGSL